MRKADVCLFMIDASESISQQDQRIAGEIVEASKGFVLVANKIDLLAPKKKKSSSHNFLITSLSFGGLLLFQSQQKTERVLKKFWTTS